MVAGPRGRLIVFEGLDQSGKQTQSELLRDALTAGGQRVRLLSFPDYDTAIGEEIRRALGGERDYGPDVMQLLYVANRYEYRAEIERGLAEGVIFVCDRYLASSVAYGEAQGLDPAWLLTIQQNLPAPDLTCLLDIAPERAAARKVADRDKYERDLALLGRVRESYLRQSASGWVVMDGAGDRAAIARQVREVVAARLGLPPAP
jgi:dTMP kinase